MEILFALLAGASAVIALVATVNDDARNAVMFTLITVGLFLIAINAR